jgi:nucleoside-diphosphate-sugar epimerase
VNIIVTGAGGFLGRYIAEALQTRGHAVYNFSRSSYPELEADGIVAKQGDLSRYEDVYNAFHGIDAVFHVAAFVEQWGRWEKYYQTNVLGTENVIRACKEQSIQKLVFTSSPSVVFEKDDLCGVDESQPYPDQSLSLYGKSKAMAEKRVLEANDGKDFLTVSLRPHLIFGPRDPHLIPTIVEAVKQGKLKIIGNGQNQVDFTYVENAADAHLQAFDQLNPGSPVCGKAYFIGQERAVKLWDFLNDKILPIYNLAPVTRRVPLTVAYGAAALMEWVYRTLGIYDQAPRLTRFLVLQLATSHYFSHKNAERDFGYRPKITLDEGLDRLRAWVQENSQQTDAAL